MTTNCCTDPAEYDGGLCFEYRGDETFDSLDDALDFCAEHEILPEDLMLVGPEPVYLKQIDFEQVYGDDGPEDYDFEKQHPEVASKLHELNELIGREKHVLWFHPSRKRIVMETPPDWEEQLDAYR